MTRQLSTQDRVLSHLSHALESLTSASHDRPLPAARLDQITAQTLRGHQAMNSAAKAWFLGRRIAAGSVKITDQQSTALDQHSRTLDKTLDQHQAGRSLLLPVVLAGGFALGASSHLLSKGLGGKDRGQSCDTDILRRATQARAQSDACLKSAHAATVQDEPTAATIEPHEARTTDATDADTRRREYSLRRGSSPSARLMNSLVSNAFDGLFKLTSKI